MGIVAGRSTRSLYVSGHQLIHRDTLYVQVFAKRFVIRNIDAGTTVEMARDQTCASPRMLIADFTVAAHQLKEGVKRVKRGFMPPDILFHPMEITDGGLTQVELRVFRELGIGAGAKRVATWEAEPLSDAEKIKKVIREYVY